ncbi:hypothetical protein [Winogradskyella sp.]|uniref:hypothetical protein n=1 Tax=Winogradskyella sp. TaxID=1883156 RepID=UPI003BA97870
MKQNLQNIWITIYWFFRKLTKKGKEDYIMQKAFAGIQESKRKGLITKYNVISSAKKLLKPKKIIAFNKGESITKPKKSDHQLIKQVSHQHKEDLSQNNLKITKKGKFTNA